MKNRILRYLPHSKLDGDLPLRDQDILMNEYIVANRTPPKNSVYGEPSKISTSITRYNAKALNTYCLIVDILRGSVANIKWLLVNYNCVPGI